MSRQADFRADFHVRLLRFLLIALALFYTLDTPAQQTTTPTLLTNAADVLSLSADQARHQIPVLVHGIVTAAEPNWHGQFFVQDNSAGIFVENLSDDHPMPGDVVEIKGITQPGAFAPIISKPTWTVLGTAPLPKAKRVSIDQLTSGLEDGQRVEITGIVRAVTPAEQNIHIEIASEGNRIHVFPKRPPNMDPQSLVGATVRARGTVAASFNAALRHLMYVVMFVPTTNDFVIEKMEGTNPFDKPVIPTSGIAEYRRDITPGERVHLKGVVTLQRPGEELFIQDASGGLHIQTHQTDALSDGDVVDVVGYPDIDHLLPVLNDAFYRKSSDKMPAPKVVSIPPIQANGNHGDLMTNHAALVTLPAKLLERTIRHSQISRGTSSIELLLQAGDLGFTAQAEIPEYDVRLGTIPIGSLVQVTGVSVIQTDEHHTLRSLQLLLPSADNLRVLRTPSWFTPQRLQVGLGILSAVLLVAVGWSATVSKKNSVLRVLIRDREKAQFQLQEAHDQLEERVKERTAQLKFQIGARKESELQFKAILKERTRLAQELHDTVEQTLTGIALQLDTASKLSEVRPESADHHLKLARSLVQQSQLDVRRSVWDLRSRSLEQFDLPGAISTSGKQITDGTNLQLSVSAKGRVRPLPETVEENLLRIAQESLTNIIKHSGATVATIELDYGPQTVTLQIKDNGQGFDREHSAGPDEGHFGLLGMSERVKRLDGKLDVSSEPGHGTTIRVQVPVEQESPSPNFAASEAAL